jgi:hypothetical protein
VFNAVADSKSQTVSYIMAAIPPAPSNGPTDVFAVTNDTEIMVEYEEMTTDYEKGGHIILSYNLQMDDGAGLWHDVHGFDAYVLNLDALVPATQGITYSFKYRVKNLYGWSDFSPVTQILAATLPSRPP